MTGLEKQFIKCLCHGRWWAAVCVCENPPEFGCRQLMTAFVRNQLRLSGGAAAHLVVRNKVPNTPSTMVQNTNTSRLAGNGCGQIDFLSFILAIDMMPQPPAARLNAPSERSRNQTAPVSSVVCSILRYLLVWGLGQFPAGGTAPSNIPLRSKRGFTHVKLPLELNYFRLQFQNKGLVPEALNFRLIIIILSSSFPNVLPHKRQKLKEFQILKERML